MPIPPSIHTAIQAIRKSMEFGGRNNRDFSLYLQIDKLFGNSARIIGNVDALNAVLALAPEVEAYRGKDSQLACREFYHRLTALIFHAKLNPPSADVRAACFDALASHFFPRVQGPPVRSQHAARLRSMAWFALGELSAFGRHPEHLAHALKVAADPRGADAEREGAIEFLGSYWAGDAPDEATADLLDDLEKNAANRDFLVTVLRTQIELGLNDEFGALCAVDDWDDVEDAGSI